MSSWDPTYDLWGVAMAASMALFALSLLVIVVLLVARRSLAPGGWLMGLSLVAFLGSAFAGTFEQIHASEVGEPPAPAAVGAPDGKTDAKTPNGKTDAKTDAKTPDGKTDAKTPADTAGANGEAAADGGTPEAGDTGAANDDGAADDAAGGDEAADGGAADGGAAADDGGAAVPVPADEAAALGIAADADEEARGVAVRLLLREGKAIAEDTKRCTDAKEVAAYWAKLSKLGSDAPHRGKAKVIVKRLEGCRRKIEWLTNRGLKKKRVAERATYGRELDKTLSAEVERATVNLYGVGNEKLRIAGPTFDQAEGDRRLAAGLRAELTAKGFAEVTFSNGRKAYRVALSPASELGLGKAQLDAIGLGSPLAL